MLDDIFVIRSNFVLINSYLDSTLYWIMIINNTVTFFMQNGFTPLYTACTFGHAKIVEMLIKNGAHIDLPTKVVIIISYCGLWFVINFHPCVQVGFTPLFAACLNGHAHIVELLIKNGAKVNVLAKVPIYYTEKVARAWLTILYF